MQPETMHSCELWRWELIYVYLRCYYPRPHSRETEGWPVRSSPRVGTSCWFFLVFSMFVVFTSFYWNILFACPFWLFGIYCLREWEFRSEFRVSVLFFLLFIANQRKGFSMPSAEQSSLNPQSSSRQNSSPENRDINISNASPEVQRGVLEMLRQF